MQSLLSLLTSFNRKERHALLDKIFENKIAYFSPKFIDALTKITGSNIPSNYNWFIDYHLDWIEAAIFYYLNKLDANEVQSINRDGDESYPKFTLDFTQRDVDFLVYFQINSCHKFIIIEAKYDTGWDNKQFRTKAGRLKEIYSNYVFINSKIKSNVSIEFYCIIMSPKHPAKLQNIEGWKWLELPQKQELYTVSRTENKKKSREGNEWSCFKTDSK